MPDYLNYDSFDGPAILPTSSPPEATPKDPYWRLSRIRRVDRLLGAYETVPDAARAEHIAGKIREELAKPDPTAQHIISAINDYEYKIYGQVYDGKEKVQLEEFIRKLTKGEKP